MPDDTTPRPRLSVDLASFKLALTNGTVEQGLRLADLLVSELGYTPDEATQIVLRSLLTVAISFHRARGATADVAAAQLEALAQRVRSGEAKSKAAEYFDELVRLGHIAEAPDPDPSPEAGTVAPCHPSR